MKNMTYRETELENKLKELQSKYDIVVKRNSQLENNSPLVSVKAVDITDLLINTISEFEFDEGYNSLDLEIPFTYAGIEYILFFEGNLTLDKEDGFYEWNNWELTLKGSNEDDIHPNCNEPKFDKWFKRFEKELIKGLDD